MSRGTSTRWELLIIEQEMQSTSSSRAEIAKLRGGSESHVHFEVRKGFESVDPTPYIQ